MITVMMTARNIPTTSAASRTLFALSRGVCFFFFLCAAALDEPDLFDFDAGLEDADYFDWFICHGNRDAATLLVGSDIVASDRFIGAFFRFPVA